MTLVDSLPKGITVEQIACLSKLADTHIQMEIDPGEPDMADYP